MGYVAELRKAMEMIATRPNAIFMGQTVKAGGSGMSKTFDAVPKDKLLELPVFEATQLGMAIGMSLAGRWPIVCVYPRINFLLEATGMLVNELDKINEFSAYAPKVIIRTAVAHDSPMNPGPQHLGHYVDQLRGMLSSVDVTPLYTALDVKQEYSTALAFPRSLVLVEYMALYDE